MSHNVYVTASKKSFYYFFFYTDYKAYIKSSLSSLFLFFSSMYLSYFKARANNTYRLFVFDWVYEWRLIFAYVNLLFKTTSRSSLSNRIIYLTNDTRKITLPRFATSRYFKSSCLRADLRVRMHRVKLPLPLARLKVKTKTVECELCIINN